jgi:hypothetical protein
MTIISKISARDGSSPKNGTFLFIDGEDRREAYGCTEAGFSVESTDNIQKIIARSTALSVAHVIARDSSSPKNATFILIISDEPLTFFMDTINELQEGIGEVAHGRVDEYQNSESDQKHRGGLGG